MEGLPQAARHRLVPLLLWPAAMDRQHRPHLRLHQRTPSLLRLPALRNLWHIRQVPEAYFDRSVAAGLPRALLLAYRLVLHLPH